MTPEQLDAIEKLAEAATPGPYQVASIYPAYGVFRVQVDEPSECVAMCAVSVNEDADEAHVERQEAHARNGANARAIAALLKYALPLVKALREAWAVIDHYERKDGPAFQAHLGEVRAEWSLAEAKAEIERLREVVRKVHALAATEEQDYRCVRVNALPLVKAVREAQKERDEAIEARAQAGYSAAQFMRKFNEAEKERDEAWDRVDNLEGVIRDNIPYHYDQGEANEDEANPEECVEYAAADIAKLKAEVERLRSAISRFVSQYPWQDGPEIQELKTLKERE